MDTNIVQSFRKGKRKKVIVFEYGQEAQIEYNTNPKPKFSTSFLCVFFYLYSCVIAQKGREEQ
jgi:hypothetical protein